MIGYVLKLVRICRDMSLKEVAQKSGISATTISGIENDKKNCSLDTLKKIVKVYQFPLSMVVYYEELLHEKKVNSEEIVMDISNFDISNYYPEDQEIYLNGAVLTALRLCNNLTMTKLANQLEINYSYVSKLEAGEKKINRPMIEKISHYFNISIDMLMYLNEFEVNNTDDLKRLMMEILIYDCSDVDENNKVK